MLSNKIALVSPNRDFTLQTLRLFAEWGEKIHVAMATKEDVIGIAQQLAERGADILICYAAFEDMVKTTVAIPTIPLCASTLDIMKSVLAVKERLLREKNTAEPLEQIVGIQADWIARDIALVAATLGLTTRIVSPGDTINREEFAVIIKEMPLLAEYETGELGYSEQGSLYFPITIGAETLRDSLRQARQLLVASRGAQVKLEQLKAVMEFTGDGIIAVDNQRRISYINHAARKLLKKSEEELVGQLAAAVLPELELEDTLRYGQTRNALLTTAAEQNLTCRIVPMILGGQSMGAVLTITEAQFLPREKDRGAKGAAEKGHRAVYTFEDFITVNEVMKETLEAAQNYAGVDSPVLICGDTGTGKEIMAQSIHNFSRRCQGPFVAINCAALPESLLESELFGYEYGAFTGARKNGKKGLFEQADQGTIFLDEIGEISPSMQSRLLRVIQQREIMRIGGDKVIAVDVGIIAATHRNLPELVEKGGFRRDLYYRLNVLQLKLLPLSARKEDLPFLVESIGKKLAAKLSKPLLQFSGAAMGALSSYSWPGNVRELEGIIERLLILKKDNIVSGEDIAKVLGREGEHQSTGMRMVPSGTLEEIEGAIIAQVLSETNSHEQTAKILGISTTTIWRKLKGISK